MGGGSCGKFLRGEAEHLPRGDGVVDLEDRDGGGEGDLARAIEGPLAADGVKERRDRRAMSIARSARVAWLMWTMPTAPWDSMRLAVFTVSPQRS